MAPLNWAVRARGDAVDTGVCDLAESRRPTDRLLLYVRWCATIAAVRRVHKDAVRERSQIRAGRFLCTHFEQQYNPFTFRLNALQLFCDAELSCRASSDTPRRMPFVCQLFLEVGPCFRSLKENQTALAW